MQNQYMQLKKLSKSIEGYYNKVIQTSYVAADWRKDKKKIEGEMDSFENQYKDLCQQIKAAEESSDSKFQSTVPKIKTDLETYRRKILPYIGAIKEKVNSFSGYELEKAEEPRKDSEHQVMAMDLMNNQEVLQQRRKELEEIHKTAAILKDTTDQMAMEVEKQGAQLEEIEANVITSKENAEKAKQEIIKADETSRGNRKKMCCLIFIILVAILGISAILLSIILNK
jgi:t-SNARE complex subunit (syntaxin)